MQITCKLDPSWINRKEIEVLGLAQGLCRVYCESQCATWGGGMESLWGWGACPEIPSWAGTVRSFGVSLWGSQVGKGF